MQAQHSTTAVPLRATSEFGEVQPGDLKYIDRNGDGVINSDDVVYLGKRYGWSGAPFTLGVNLTVKWKDFTLFALGTGYFGGTGVKNSEYYRVYGDRKYSEVVLNRWTEATKETAGSASRYLTRRCRQTIIIRSSSSNSPPR
ncbi:MAG: hypothetical protein LUC22_01590, partial [Prevotella sp.]|nr:hypothetical protein [Prevotella sp.]